MAVRLNRKFGDEDDLDAVLVSGFQAAREIALGGGRSIDRGPVGVVGSVWPREGRGEAGGGARVGVLIG